MSWKTLLCFRTLTKFTSQTSWWTRVAARCVWAWAMASSVISLFLCGRIRLRLAISNLGTASTPRSAASSAATSRCLRHSPTSERRQGSSLLFCTLIEYCFMEAGHWDIFVNGKGNNISLRDLGKACQEIEDAVLWLSGAAVLDTKSDEPLVKPEEGNPRSRQSSPLKRKLEEDPSPLPEYFKRQLTAPVEPCPTLGEECKIEKSDLKVAYVELLDRSRRAEEDNITKDVHIAHLEAKLKLFEVESNAKEAHLAIVLEVITPLVKHAKSFRKVATDSFSKIYTNSDMNATGRAARWEARILTLHWHILKPISVVWNEQEYCMDVL
ncbi:hypothetical protein BU25DRAFT_418884 [Macroventuria anomochaeta]|uniref:Uncharacterized protein n=1 Tax=Macroventuria anomochaeta TaxID=301207 RepID=A0ACB6SCG1_9PLEO|nr:uncharacterized protein BU25DRAFT_418884 [Macroventuria anomochaeta]KAF2631285.1 hypothetical protein BU25DRAFT_418884 [Macroventuria anomochaeta]